MNIEREMLDLIAYLNYHTKLYNEGVPELSDSQWDSHYFQLKHMEEKTGIIFPHSPTRKIQYEVKNELTKVKHNHPMLSLDKTKDWDEFINHFTAGKDVIGMLKLDGLTCSLRYKDHFLVSAETRGNGEIGEDILHNAKVIDSIPDYINYSGELVIDGEIICTEKDFEPFSNEYKNPRNFASGSIRLLDSKECEKRNLTFIAWNVVKGMEEENSFMGRLHNLIQLDFCVVPYTSSFDWDAKEFLINKAKELGYPIDGLVGRYDDIAYGESLGATGHHSNAAYAFKFYDEEYETTLQDIEWTMGRTGVLTPVAIFEPIEADGTTIERASLHNISVMFNLYDKQWHSGLSLKVFKANQIIPQISSVEFKESSKAKNLNPPLICPICKGETSIKDNDGVQTLWCTNPNCEGKLVNRIDHYCGKKGLEIRGLSKATIEKLIDWEYVEKLSDIYTLQNWKKDWISKPCFGEKSVSNILGAIETSKNCGLASFISAIGIPLVGRTISREICKYYATWDEFRNAVGGEWSYLDGFGPEIEKAINNFDYTEADKIAEMLTFEQVTEQPNDTIDLPFKDKIFVITGRLQLIQNREKLISIVEKNGGKVVSSVSSKTSVLINNDINSNSAKNKKAKELNIPIITEEDFLNQCVIKE